MTFNEKQIKYICKELLGIGDWTPELQPGTFEVLNLCQSKLEIMFLLGAIYYLDKIAQANGMGKIPINQNTIEYHGGKYPSLILYDAWNGFWYCGPSAMALTPQIGSSGLHYDFAIFYSDDNSGGNWRLKYIIEVDGYGAHRGRREKDSYRDALLDEKGIKHFRLYEETADPLTWFDMVENDFLAETLGDYF